jgi:hypothetical protein
MVSVKRHIPLLLMLAALPALAWAQAPTLVPAALSSVAPTGMVRGGPVGLTLQGVNISGATRVVFDDPAITGTPAPGTGSGQVKVAAVIGPTARVGTHTLLLQTPLGTTGSVSFVVGGWPEAAEKEPNDGSVDAAEVKLPATLVGTLDRTGDADRFRFRAEAGQELVFQCLVSPIRSRLDPQLRLLDASGKVLEEARAAEGTPDPVLGFRFREAGTYALEVRDFQNQSGGDVTYRISAGAFLYATQVFPPGVPADGGKVMLKGWNLGAGVQVEVKGAPGSIASVTETPAGPLLAPVRVAVGKDPELEEAGGANDAPGTAQAVEAPSTVNGRIAAERGADVDCYRFRSRKGERWVLDVQARRLGSPLDSYLEVLDAKGRPIERATLRCLAQTVLTLNDRDSAASGFRLLAWNDLSINDHVYAAGELLQVANLPQGPDDDLRFRTLSGVRVGYLDTTPTAHALNEPVYKVQVYPPGRTFPPNGMPVFRLYYRNDDGGPLYGKDSRLAFMAPEDGEYIVRIGDVRGDGGDRFSYRLNLRQPRPDFSLSMSPPHPNVPAGASVPVDVSVERRDGFDGEVRLALEGLPEGLSATSTTIEPGEQTATLLLTAAPDAKTPAGARVRLVGTGRTESGEITRALEPGGGQCLLTVLPGPDLTVRTAARKITIAPGKEQYVEASITRENGFAGRVPISLRNLPFGVRVLDVGLNGVLITEAERARRFTVYCEPWVKPMQRMVYCTVRTETGSPASTEVAAEPILLEVAP